ncbi:hypothetical protein J6590_043094 [Homalodisca vitripennis]|nr:hypothetical protein J6590_043094 [Homalodisca vitripennis]
MGKTGNIPVLPKPVVVNDSGRKEWKKVHWQRCNDSSLRRKVVDSGAIGTSPRERARPTSRHTESGE